ncbi:MAG: hypothetical protein ABIE84_05190, partial [bacterium]
MSIKNIFVCSFVTLLIGLSFFVFFSPAAEADQANSREKDYGPEYFQKISGEINGQTAPGVEKVLVNGEEVSVNKDQRFSSKVTLKSGEKYLIIETRYNGLRFIKKYLVVRHPGSDKSFKISLPQKEFENMVKSPPTTAGKSKTETQNKMAAAPDDQLIIMENPVKTSVDYKYVGESSTAKTDALLSRLLSWLKRRPAKTEAATGELQKIADEEIQRYLEKHFASYELQKVFENETKNFLVEFLSKNKTQKAAEQQAKNIVDKNLKTMDIDALFKTALSKNITQALAKIDTQAYSKAELTKMLQQELAKLSVEKIVKAEVAIFAAKLQTESEERVKNLTTEIIIIEAKEAVAQQAPGIITEKAEKYVKEKADSIIEAEAKKAVKQQVAKGEIEKLIREQIPVLLNKEIERIVAKDVP